MSPIFQLAQLGTLSGDLLGYLGTDTTYPNQPLVGATVSAVKCSSGTTPPCPTTGATLTATSDPGGHFQISGPASPFVMSPGNWQVTISAFGYTSLSQVVPIVAGSNSLPINHLFTTPVTLNVGILIGPNTLFACPAATPTCATVTLNRIDTGQTVSVSTASTTTPHRYAFTNLNPATYVVTISGEGLTQTSTQYTVPLATTQPLDVPVAVVQNTVSGSVNGPMARTPPPLP
jgi:hypothetical protein